MATVSPSCTRAAKAVTRLSRFAFRGPLGFEAMGHGFGFQRPGRRQLRGLARGFGQDFVDHRCQALRAQVCLVEVAFGAQLDGIRHHVGIADPGNENRARKTRAVDGFAQPVGSRLAVSEIVVQQQYVVGSPVEVRPGLAQAQARILGDLDAGDFLVEKNVHGFQGNFTVVDQQNFHGSTEIRVCPTPPGKRDHPYTIGRNPGILSPPAAFL